MATTSRKLIGAGMLNKVVREAIRRELAIAGREHAKCIVDTPIQTIGLADDGCNWNVRVDADVAVWMIAKSAVDDVRSRYELKD